MHPQVVLVYTESTLTKPRSETLQVGDILVGVDASVIQLVVVYGSVSGHTAKEGRRLYVELSGCDCDIIESPCILFLAIRLTAEDSFVKPEDLSLLLEPPLNLHFGHLCL